MGVEEEEEERGGMERRRGGVEALGMRRKEEIERDMARWEGESSRAGIGLDWGKDWEQALI